MASKPTRVYWDTSVFIEYFNDDPNSPHRDAVTKLLASAKAGTLQICTSVLSITEAAFIRPLEFQGKAFIGGHTDVLDDMWNDYPAILLIRCDARIARDARAIKRWARQKSIGRVEPDDLVHLATARFIKAARISTLDEHWFPYFGYTSIPIGFPEALAPGQQTLPLLEPRTS